MIDEPSRPTPYIQVTSGVEVSVWPELESKQSHFDTTLYTYVYTIKIRNNTPDTIHLRRRSWRIVDGFGHEEHVEGPGVVGQEPLLRHGESFLYSSFCPLTTPTGTMVGFFEFENSNGKTFKVDVPKFELKSAGLMN